VPELDTEFTALIEKANALGIAAEAHDATCEASCGHPNHECFENRVYIVALVMNRLGMSIVDVGFVADKLLEIQCEDGCEPCGAEGATDDWPPVVGERDN